MNPNRMGLEEQTEAHALLAKAAMAHAMGMDAYLCGTRKDGSGWD